MAVEKDLFSCVHFHIAPLYLVAVYSSPVGVA